MAKRENYIIAVIIVLAIAALAYFLRGSLSKSASTANVETASTTTTTTTTTTNTASSGDSTVQEPPTDTRTFQYTQEYKNDKYGFSFKYPDDFTVSVVPSDAYDAIVIKESTGLLDPNAAGVQILISPWTGGADVDMTPQIIVENLPDMTVEEPQTVIIGASQRSDLGKGLAFIGNNPSFGGKSREVWFIYEGNLYQISTFYAYDGFLKGLFATWQFDK